MTIAHHPMISIPQTYAYSCLGLVGTHSRDVLFGELVSGVGDEETCFTHSPVTDHHALDGLGSHLALYITLSVAS